MLDAVGEAELVFLAPSNPFVSLAPILAVPGIRAAVEARRERVVAVSPIVGGEAVRGPLVGILESLGHEPSVVGVARLHAELAATFVMDPADAALAPEIEALGLRAVVAPIVMIDPDMREAVGRAVLEAVR